VKSFSKDKSNEELKPIFIKEDIELFSTLDELWKFNWDELHSSNDLTWLMTDDLARKKFNARLQELLKIEKELASIEVESKKDVQELEEKAELLAQETDEISDFFMEMENTFFLLMDEWFLLTKKQSNRKEMYVIMRKLIIARTKVMHGDEFQKNWVRKFERMLDAMSKGVAAEYNSTKERVFISISLKMQLDMKSISVKEYHYYMEAAIEMNTNPVNNA